MEMSNLSNESLEFLFHPRSVALVGITTANPGHWTRGFLDGPLALKFKGSLYLVNPKGGKIKGLKVYPSLQDIPDPIDYVIGLVPARVAPRLVEESAEKGVRAIHFCTAGFSETGEEEGTRLEAELVEISRRKQIRILGPNCMGIYCPQSRLSFNALFPKESGPVAFMSQSGLNAMHLVRQAMLRGIRFSKVISYGNACDLNESDFLEYLAADADTKIITIYIEGIRNGRRFRQALEKAAKEKTVILLKGGLTEGGTRAVASHTASLAGNEATWDSLCKQLGIMRVDSLDELIDVLVTLLFMPLPRGRNVALFCTGGGPSVIKTDEFERRGLRVPSLPQETVSQIREYTPAAGTILRNPVDYQQGPRDLESLFKTINIISDWEGIDFFVMPGYRGTGPPPRRRIFSRRRPSETTNFLKKIEAVSKPVALVVEPSISPEEAKRVFASIQEYVSSRLPVYHSYANTAKAISLVLSHNENRLDR